MRIVHISQTNFNKIMALSYHFGEVVRDGNRLTEFYKKGDTIYHVLSDDEAKCLVCGSEIKICEAQTPTELETWKWHNLERMNW